jgi:ADP-heptose:LPS heptosyltransferase
VLVLRPGALGDTLLAVPALRALRRRFGRVTLAAHGATAQLLVSLGEVEAGLAFDDPSLAWLFSSDSPRSDEPIVAWLANAERMPALRGAVVVAPGRPSSEQHCAEYLLRTLGPLGVEPQLDTRPLKVSPLSSDEILVHPGSGSVAKNWPAERFASVIRALHRPARLIVGEADTQAAAAVEACLGHRLPRLEQPTLEELAPRLAGCHAYLGNDSGVSHLAGLCGAHTVVLFGPTSPDIWRPVGPDVHTEWFDAEPERIAQCL